MKWDNLGLDPQGECVISVVYDPQSRQNAKGQALSALKKGATAQQVMQTYSISDNPFRAKAREAAEAQAHAVADGAALYRHNLYVLAAGKTPREAESTWADVVTAGVRAGCEVSRMYGQQDAALAAVLPLCRGV